MSCRFSTNRKQTLTNKFHCSFGSKLQITTKRVYPIGFPWGYCSLITFRVQFRRTAFKGTTIMFRLKCVCCAWSLEFWQSSSKVQAPLSRVRLYLEDSVIRVQTEAVQHTPCHCVCKPHCCFCSCSFFSGFFFRFEFYLNNGLAWRRHVQFVKSTAGGQVSQTG